MKKFVSLDKRSKKAQKEYQRIGREFRDGFDAGSFLFEKVLDKIEK